MNKYFLLLLLLPLAGASCNQPASIISETTESIPEQAPQIEEPEIKEVVPVAERKEPAVKTLPEKSDQVALYKGYWFDVEYPADFDFEPKELVNYHEGVRMILTDQAWFTSPDNTVEFYVHSPLWSSYPEYLDILSTEELVSEKTSETGSDLNKNIVTWKTIAAKDGSYTRSYVHYETGAYELGSGTSHVFGIKYANQAAYDKYRDVYIKFKASLQQYAD